MSHDQIEAMTLAHSVAIVEGGFMNRRPMFVAGFIGSPPMNFIHGELGWDNFSAPRVSADKRLVAKPQA
ncbi:MAG: hypothetical protein ACE5Q3_11025 [Alphaproteobacteria bacterium]